MEEYDKDGNIDAFVKAVREDAIKHIREVMQRYDKGEHTTGIDFIEACRADIEGVG